MGKPTGLMLTAATVAALAHLNTPTTPPEGSSGGGDRGSARFVHPVAGARLTSGYGPRPGGAHYLTAAGQLLRVRNGLYQLPTGTNDTPPPPDQRP
jgi:hypothetical protein